MQRLITCRHSSPHSLAFRSSNYNCVLIVIIIVIISECVCVCVCVCVRVCVLLNVYLLLIIEDNISSQIAVLILLSHSTPVLLWAQIHALTVHTCTFPLQYHMWLAMRKGIKCFFKNRLQSGCGHKSTKFFYCFFIKNNLYSFYSTLRANLAL